MQKIEFITRNGVEDLNLLLFGNFNTFRHGNKWTCLKVGETVELVAIEKGSPVRMVHNGPEAIERPRLNTIIGEAVVTGITFGSLSDMVIDYAHDNYETPDEAELVGILASAYGPEKVGRTELYTVVHLVRMVP